MQLNPPQLNPHLEEEIIVSADSFSTNLGQRRTNENEPNLNQMIDRYGNTNNKRKFINDILGLGYDGVNINYVEFIEAAKNKLNAEKIRVHFTPYENTIFKKLILMYDVIANHYKNIICARLNLPKTMPIDDVIQEASHFLNDRFNIQIDTQKKFGFKLVDIVDYLDSQGIGGKRKKRRNKSKGRNKSQGRNKSKRYKK